MFGVIILLEDHDIKHSLLTLGCMFPPKCIDSLLISLWPANIQGTQCLRQQTNTKTSEPPPCFMTENYNCFLSVFHVQYDVHSGKKQQGESFFPFKLAAWVIIRLNTCGTNSNPIVPLPSPFTITICCTVMYLFLFAGGSIVWLFWLCHCKLYYFWDKNTFFFSCIFC